MTSVSWLAGLSFANWLSILFSSSEYLPVLIRFIGLASWLSERGKIRLEYNWVEPASLPCTFALIVALLNINEESSLSDVVMLDGTLAKLLALSVKIDVDEEEDESVVETDEDDDEGLQK